MKNDGPKGRVSVVAMRVPKVGGQINFDIAMAGQSISELDNSTPEVWPRFMIPEARVQNSHGLAIGRLEFIAPEPLMMPDELKQLLR